MAAGSSQFDLVGGPCTLRLTYIGGTRGGKLDYVRFEPAK
jgi:hypothetical protein